VLGDGWYPLDFYQDSFVRYVQSTSEILLINPDNKSQTVNLQIELQSFTENKNINLEINETINMIPIRSDYKSKVLLENIILLPGSNSVTLVSDDSVNIDPKKIYKTMESKTILEKEFEISHLVYSISLER
jgi:hypothetical protein